MKTLQLQTFWAVAQSDGLGKVEYLSAVDGAAVDANDKDRLTDFARASGYMHRLHERNGQWPMPYAIALSLSASQTLAIDLHGGFDEMRCEPCEGAWLWLQKCASYAELCWPGDYGRAIRVVGRGEVPEEAVVPPRVEINTSGFCTLTGFRIPTFPASRGEDNSGIITDVTQALEQLLVPHEPTYIEI